jgi:PEP-CTERM motif-containing protein
MITLNRSKNSVYRPLLGAALLVSAAGAAHAQSFTNIIDPLNPTFTQALGINDSDTIVGYGNATTFNGFTLTLPPVAANFTRLNVPGADGGTQVTGIDAAGDTVGFSITAGVTNGFAHTGGTFTTVDDPGFAFTQLLGISSNGATAAGYWTHDSTGATGQLAGIVTGGPGFTSPTFIGINDLLPSNVNSQATGVNDGGWIVGFYQQPTTDIFTGFVDKSGVVSIITVPGSADTQALGVNDLGWIVGDYTLANGDMFGFLDRGGVFTTIDPFGSTAVTANGINDLGQIVGFYTAAVGADQSTIGFETTIPEPSTWAMMLAGFAGLGFLSYRKVRMGALAA